MSYPIAPFRHLQRLTDNIGLLRDADGVVPLRAGGYSVDDVARGLLVVCREPSPSHDLVVLDKNVFDSRAVSDDALRTMSSALTVVGGKIVYDAGLVQAR